MGELVKAFQTGPKGGRPTKNGAAAGTVSQRDAANAAGVSKHQEKTAVRISNVPDSDFEAVVESDEGGSPDSDRNRVPFFMRVLNLDRLAPVSFFVSIGIN